ncbi:MAG: hypothetical protein KDD22_01035, partial [Bdellovibrionales bacterium]|nr:hypothetical protein [Bdellovibrionales bacterium]
MEASSASTSRKALKINLDESIYGTFAEIGAGQEVARHFFQAGKASATVAKTISAYDMTFSDAIYGKDTRYVCESRLKKMLDHEYSLLIERLDATRGEKTRFFAFANTVTTSSRGRGHTDSHGWLGLRFQMKPRGPIQEIILHVRLWDRFRLRQQEALGRLGVNLIWSAFNFTTAEEFIQRIQDNIEGQRVEVDLLRFNGEGFKQVDQRLSALELVRQGLTEVVVFDPQGHVQLASELLYQRPCLIFRGTFRPVTNTNLEILEKSKEQFINCGVDPKRMRALFELTMHSLTDEGKLNKQDFLDRVDTLTALGHPVMVSNFFLFYQLKTYLRTCTKDQIALVMGASHLEKLFDEIYYQNLGGGILEGFARLFDDQTA